MAKEIKLFICGEYKSEYEDEWDAEDCCKPEISERIVYECEECKERFSNEHDANECCANQNLDIFMSNKSQEIAKND